MSAIEDYEKERTERIDRFGSDNKFKENSSQWLEESMRKKYVYNFSFLGRPIIQYPQDMIAMQEIIWQVKPDLIIETGIAHGGSLMLSASMLEINASCGGTKEGFVLGIDVDIRDHNRMEIESHPMSKRIKMIQGSSISSEIIERVRKHAEGKEKILVILDSNHTHEHVLAELEAYARLVTVGSYCVVFDTFVEDLPSDVFPDRPWGPGDNPKTAAWEYLSSHPEFEIDNSIQQKLLLTTAPDGYLKRIK
ncbi:cephalosporin hydroxylase family protein [Gammaproteobacteria bacterium]|nr:cephalosporin hydroxylase family protein [Gammaproteobacteria bacterium]